MTRYNPYAPGASPMFPEDTPNIKQLRELAKKAEIADEAEARAVIAERKIAVLESGVDTSTPLGNFFVDHLWDAPDEQSPTADEIRNMAKANDVPLREGP